MTVEPWSDRHATEIWAAAAFVGPAVAGLSSLARPTVQDNHAILLLVLVVAVISAAGLRAAGIAAAVTSALAYDYCWTEPYGSLVIADAGDVITVLLLVVIAAASGQLSWWVSEQRAAAERQRNYLEAVKLAAGSSSAGSSAASSLDAVCQALTAVLEADGCRVAAGQASGGAQLHDDGTVTRGDETIDVERFGLPTDDLILVPVGGASFREAHPEYSDAHFEVSATSHIARPSLEQRQVAALVARLAEIGLPSAR